MDNEVMGQTENTPSDNEKQDIIGKCSRCGGEVRIDRTGLYNNVAHVWARCEECDATDLIAVREGNGNFMIVKQEDV